MPKQLSARERLAQHMDSRRVDLALRWADVAAMSGVSTETLRQARQGPGAIRPLTKRGIERALQWEAGSVNRILAGGEPVPVNVKISDELPSLPPGRADLHALLDRLADGDLERARGYLTALVQQR